MKHKKIYNGLTPNPDHFLNWICQYSSSIFPTVADLKSYATNIMGEQGTHLFITDLKSFTLKKEGSPVKELIPTDGDIKLNLEVLGDPSEREALIFQENSIETSLKTYLKFLYIEYPSNVVVKINGKAIETKNPYS